jgi:hypothetical protein
MSFIDNLSYIIAKNPYNPSRKIARNPNPRFYQGIEAQEIANHSSSISY